MTIETSTIDKSAKFTPDVLIGKRVYIAPDNPAGRNLSESLKVKGVNILGRIDNLKQADGVINHINSAKPHDIILVAESDFQQAIIEGMLKNGFKAQRIYRQLGANSFAPYQTITWWKRVKNFISKRFERMVRALPPSGIVYYAENFVDANTLTLFSSHRQVNKRVHLLVKSPFTCFHPHQKTMGSWQKIRLLRAKTLIIDHEFHGSTFTIARKRAHTIQLWHGLPFKYLAGNKHFDEIEDDIFLSNSQWFNDNVFSHLFRAKQFKALGYPRNDALIAGAATRCWNNAQPLSTLNTWKGNKRLLVYMPTFRDSGDNRYPIDWDKLQHFLLQINALLVVKLHPFVNTTENIQHYKQCANIIEYPTKENIYPWLAEADLLITDYSSVAIDFLLCDKPIVYFNFDIELYKSYRGKFVLSPESFMVGPSATTTESLIEAIAQQLENDDYRSQRAAFKHHFGLVDTCCSDDVIRLVEDADTKRT